MNINEKFFNRINREMEIFNFEQSLKFPAENTLKIDLHCHDYNSSEPDEVQGRILNIPETWLPTDELFERLKDNGCDVFTVTNHNNARSCYELRDMGIDVLTGAEFSCYVPDYNIGIHVLAYGFTSDQETKLLKYKSDIYRFQRYALENDIPTVWAHPLYHYKEGVTPSMDFFDKMLLIFERFEVINGQRDSWQNLLVKNWIDSAGPEQIKKHEKKFNIKSSDYCSSSDLKAMFGGSDSHMGIFAGLTGTVLYVDNLQERRKSEPLSQLALEAIKNGAAAPYGGNNNTERMTITFLDYFCQIGINMKDPGLLRLLLHKGTVKDKLLSFFLLNGFSELQRHKLTINFLKLFHQCLKGEVPGFMKKIMVPADYRPIFTEVSSIARTRKTNGSKMAAEMDRSVQTVFRMLTELAVSRLDSKLKSIVSDENAKFDDPEWVINNLELPGHARILFENSGRKSGKTPSISEFLDGLTFPFLAASIIAGANYTSTRVLYKARAMLNAFSEKHGKFQFPQRMLWVSDTFDDGNGVSMFLRHMLREIQERDLPVDIMICSETVEPEDHLIVVKPAAEYIPPFYKEQPIRIPNVMEVNSKSRDGEYDRLLCSTEGPMGAIALFLKSAYSIEASFYVHTDWMTFGESVFNLSPPAMNRLRRILRGFYGSFDNIILLNKEQRRWFGGPDMNFEKSRLKLTAHWVDAKFYQKEIRRKELFNIEEDEKVLLYVGRISEEKGVMELPYIYDKARKDIPGLKLVIAGKGPDEKRLRSELPDAVFTGWVDQSQLPDIYSSADMLILPSRFDTFGNVVIEAFSCGCPVISYKTKGPADLIENDVSGYLVKTMDRMAEKITEYMSSGDKMEVLKDGALKRAKDFEADVIVNKLMKDVGMNV